MGEGKAATLVRVAIECDGRRFDAAMPSDWPVASLLPDLPVPSENAAARSMTPGAFDWRDAPRGWRRALREVAADLVAAWPSLDATLTPGRLV